MRPASIINFERLFLLSLALGGVSLLLFREDGAELPLIELGGLAVMLALALFVSRGRSNVGRWILSVLTVLGFPALLYSFVTGDGLDLSWGLSFVVAAMQLGAVAMLFGKAAAEWFASRSAAAT